MTQKIDGVVLRVFNPKTTKTNKKYYDFVVKNREDGKECKCRSWESIDGLIPDADISFNATYNEQFNNYKIYNDSIQIRGVSEESKKEAAQTTATSTPPPAPKPKKDREEFREVAEDTVKKNIKSAKKVIKSEKLEGVDTVDLADLIGRTMTAMTIDANKSW